MQLTAKLLQLLPLQTGNGKNGQWKKQDIIVETEGQYPKKVCISIWGDKIDPSMLEPGAMLNFDFDVESREFNGRWYTDVKAWRVQPAAAAAAGPAPSSGDAYNDFPPGDMGNEDLPF